MIADFDHKLDHPTDSDSGMSLGVVRGTLASLFPLPGSACGSFCDHDLGFSVTAENIWVAERKIV
jgi:hypothetical protein